jgi:protocatechuate 3,4-dioxygenase beta subunit
VAAAAFVVAAACSDKTINAVSLLPAVITVNSTSNGQTGTIGQPLPQPIGVQVTDQSGNPVANVVVTWTVLTGGGSVAAATSTTDGNGTARVIWTLGPDVGENTLRASIATGASVTITATGVVTPTGLGRAITIVSGNGQTLGVNTISQPLVVQVTDQAGKPVAGAVVTWTVSAGGTIGATSTTTDANGQTEVGASAPAPTTMTVTATTDGLPPAVFTLTLQ